MQHTLRMLELVRRTDVPVVPGAVFPLVRTQQETLLEAQTIGKQVWMGAWEPAGHGPWIIPPLREGAPTAKPFKKTRRTS